MVGATRPFERISDEQAEKLLLPHEVVRDPVQHDITITALERAITDTDAFQRLRWLNQLGPTQVVYPGAVHTRFLHSLGTLQVAEQLIQIANKNQATYGQPYLVRVEVYPHLLARLCALLHDVAHMPFGHTLEDEGNLADPEWEDAQRADHWMGRSSEITKRIESFLRESGIGAGAAKSFADDVRTYVLFKGEPDEMEYPFVIDLIGNTLCADLLDYVYRDMYFCGLPERCGDRVIKYVAVVRVKRQSAKGLDGKSYDPVTKANDGKGRVALLTYRYEYGHLAGEISLKEVDKLEIISEAIDLLRRRYALAEKVYFHRTKLAASSMLISAMASASVVRIKDVYAISDSEFLDRLRRDPGDRTKRIMSAYMSRRLYKPIYRIGFREESDSDAESKKLWGERYPLFRKPQWRNTIENELERYGGLPPGAVTVYCPDRNMNLKEFEMLVQSRSGAVIKPLKDILDHSREMEMEAINQRFAPLWSLFVFVDPSVLDVSAVNDERVQDLNAACEFLLGFPNDNLALRGKGRPLKEQVADRVIKDYQSSSSRTVPYAAFESLVHADFRGSADLLERMTEQLHALMEGSKS